ncbi:hypothetical protein EYF80_027570 [Liparis tanakae]|uniref:Uncharacterized protein n=1 Tax=Liparis tanakae TaxID=230148 RepID=A0A4Z2H9J9_9TELE|nr:hypothetical protein EYF80_027570 [Liparis tanakae]
MPATARGSARPAELGAIDAGPGVDEPTPGPALAQPEHSGMRSFCKKTQQSNGAPHVRGHQRLSSPQQSEKSSVTVTAAVHGRGGGAGGFHHGHLDAVEKRRERGPVSAGADDDSGMGGVISPYCSVA